MTEHKFDFEKEEEIRRNRALPGLTKELAKEETTRLAKLFMKEAGDLYDRLYPNLKNDGLRKVFILALFLGTQDVIMKETLP